jgi:beta-glucosidase
MNGRTYRYFKGEPLYPFGYGLSFTSFTYDRLNLPATAEKGKSLSVNVRVTNSGKMNGEEVVQLYVSNQNKNVHAPIRALKGFQRIFLKAGESKIIQFDLTAEQLSLVGEDGKLYQPEGNLEISIGGGQPGVKKGTSGNTAVSEIKII